MSTTCAHPHSTENNGYTSSQRKAGQTWSKYAILAVDLEERKNNDDSHGRYIAFTSGNSQRIRCISAYRQALHRFRTDRGNHGRQPLQGAAIRIRPLPSQTHKARNIQPIKKATIGWQGTTTKLFTVALPCAWKQKVKRPRDALSVTSIHDQTKFCNGFQIALCNRVRDRKNSVPVTSKYNFNINSHLDPSDLLKLCNNDRCAAIMLDEMYYRSFEMYRQIIKFGERFNSYYPTNLSKLSDMANGMFDEYAVIEALKIINRKGYAHIVTEQNGCVCYKFSHSTLHKDLKRLEVKTTSSIKEKLIQPQHPRTRRNESKVVKFHNKRAENVALPATLTIEQWHQTVRHFHHKCAYCLTGDYEVLEHFIPLMFGGGTTAYNCVPSCSSCNGIKGDQHPSMISHSVWMTEALQQVKQYLETRKMANSEA